jgi:hypothetical protein
MPTLQRMVAGGGGGDSLFFKKILKIKGCDIFIKQYF